MTDAPSTPPTNGTPHDPHLDRLAQLHRMSRTAGLGSTEYAAVNTAAVMAAVLGAASSLTLMSPIFLFISVIGLIIAIIAIVQIVRSNGTQTGIILAILGLVLSLAFSAGAGVKAIRAQSREVRDTQTLNALVITFGDLLAKEDYTAAYAMFDEGFRSRVSQKKFQEFFTSQLIPIAGKIPGMKSNGQFVFDEDPQDPDVRLARGVTLIDLARVPRTNMTYRFDGKEWKIANLDLIPPEPSQGPGQGSPPAGPAPAPLPAAPAGPPVPQG
jgi:hypothetical protein